MSLLSRRQLVKALGLSAAFGRAALAGPGASPSRVVFFITPHGHVPNGWNVPMAGVPRRDYAEAQLPGPSALPPVLAPLAAHRERLLVAEGLAHTGVLFDIAEVMREGGDLNNHQVAVADLLTGARAAQIFGARCTGGARSIDQVLGDRLAGPGRFATRVYGADYVPNQTVSPFSYLGPKQATPVVHDPATAFADLLGLAQPPAQSPLEPFRASVLDAVAEEYGAVAAPLGGAARERLDAHRQLVRDLELSLTRTATASCALELDTSNPDRITQFCRLIRLALACDLTRVVTYVAPVPLASDLGYPSNADFHGYAHASMRGATSCGAMYFKIAEQAMVHLGAWYAEHLALLLDELSAVPEGDGTLLDHTAVVWLTELGTPTHRHDDVFTLVAGGMNGAFHGGRYLHFPRRHASPLASMPELIGPSQTRLFVNLLRAVGGNDDYFGLPSVSCPDGSVVSMSGPLSRL